MVFPQLGRTAPYPSDPTRSWQPRLRLSSKRGEARLWQIHLPALAYGWPDGSRHQITGVSSRTVNTGTTSSSPAAPEPLAIKITRFSPARNIPRTNSSTSPWEDRPHHAHPPPPGRSLSHPLGHRALFLCCLQTASQTIISHLLIFMLGTVKLEFGVQAALLPG